MTSALHHVSVFVSDMERAISLFSDILGFKLEWHIRKANGNLISTLMGIQNLEVELAYLVSAQNAVGIELSSLIHPEMDDSPASFGTVGTCCFSLTVKDLDGLHTQLSQEGWAPVSPCLELNPPGGGSARAFCVRLEPGVMLELIEEEGQ